MDASRFVGGSSMSFDHGQAVNRLRRVRVVDPYNPDRFTLGGWDSASSLLIDGAFIASSSSNSPADATRSQIITAKSLFCDAVADVLANDRIVCEGVIYAVDAVPSADVNPFTGWRPAREVPLTEVRG